MVVEISVSVRLSVREHISKPHFHVSFEFSVDVTCRQCSSVVHWWHLICNLQYISGTGIYSRV